MNRHVHQEGHEKPGYVARVASGAIIDAKNPFALNGRDDGEWHNEHGNQKVQQDQVGQEHVSCFLEDLPPDAHHDENEEIPEERDQKE